MQQYFMKKPYESDALIIEDKDTIKHMFQVMRLSDGDKFIAVFQDGRKYLAEIIDKDKHMVGVLEEVDSYTELPLDVTVAMGFPKGDKLEFLAQKLTELGANHLWAYPADWSVVKWDAKKLAKKSEKLEKIAQGAAEQSKRHRVPNITLFEKKAQFLEAFTGFDHILVAYEESAKEGETSAFKAALNEMKKHDKVLIIFGPEGGISEEEILIYKEKQAHIVGLGPRIMRTETAPLYALSAISYNFELAD